MKLCTCPGRVCAALAVALAAMTQGPCAWANIYATDVKLNGGTASLSLGSATNIAISYILNEPASAGVTVRILSGNTAVRTLNLTNGAPGTVRGLNTNVVWDGTDDSGQVVPNGVYGVSITAASQGYTVWTKITDDDNPGNYTWESRGIAVDRNTNSPYYGRVFVGNSYNHSPPGSLPGDDLGVQKLNADGSYADEGGFATGGVAWNGNYTAPWRIRVSADDNVYVGDVTGGGDIYRFDPTLSSNSMLHVFAPAADRSQGQWTGFCLTGQGTNTVLWGADDNYPGSLGLKEFPIRTDGTFDPAGGTQVVAVGGTPGLNLAPYALSVDGGGNLYTLQFQPNQGQDSALVMRFPAYDPSANTNQPETQAAWVAGPGDDYCGGFGLAVDPTGTYLAACFWGYLSSAYTSGNTKIFYATNGMLVTNLDLGITFSNSLSPDWTDHIDTDCDWDAVGNLYYLDDVPGCWRAFSPPGANQATTRALPLIQIGSAPVVQITSIVVSGTNVIITFTGGPGDAPASFALLSSADVHGPYTLVPGALITGGNGAFQATTGTNGATQFYEVQRVNGTPQAPTLLGLTVGSGVVTLHFTGAGSDPASAFTLLSSGSVKGTYTAVTNAVVSGSNGLYQFTVTTNGPAQFYRVKR